MLRQSLRGRLRIGTSAANGGNPAVRLNHVALPAQEERLIFIADQQQGLQISQKLIRTPIAAEFYRGPAQVSVILLQFPLKRLKSVNASAVEPANPAKILSLKSRRIFFAECLITDSPSVTWPSPAKTTVPLRRTDNTVVDRISRFCAMSAIFDYSSARSPLPNPYSIPLSDLGGSSQRTQR